MLSYRLLHFHLFAVYLFVRFIHRNNKYVQFCVQNTCRNIYLAEYARACVPSSVSSVSFHLISIPSDVYRTEWKTRAQQRKQNLRDVFIVSGLLSFGREKKNEEPNEQTYPDIIYKIHVFVQISKFSALSRLHCGCFSPVFIWSLNWA